MLFRDRFLVLQNDTGAISLTNFKHETILTPGVTLLIVKAPCPAFFGHGTELNGHRAGKLGTIVRQDHGK